MIDQIDYMYKLHKIFINLILILLEMVLFYKIIFFPLNIFFFHFNHEISMRFYSIKIYDTLLEYNRMHHIVRMTQKNQNSLTFSMVCI